MELDDCSSARESSVHVLVVSDVRLYREGLAEILVRNGRIVVVGTAADADTCLEAATSLRPDVVLIDTAMQDGLGALQALVAVEPATRVVVLTIAGADCEIIPWAEAGAIGYVTRDGSVDDLIAAIASVAHGDPLCPPMVEAALLRRVAQVAMLRLIRGSSTGLTKREAEILRLVDQGLSNKAIALRLGIAFATVKNHVHNILEKLDVRSRVEAAARIRGL